MNSLKLIVSAHLLALLGCAQSLQTLDADDPKGPVTVTVTAERDIEVDREPMHVRGRNVVLKWKLKADAVYQFTDKGIEVTHEVKNTGLTPVNSGDFVDCEVQGNGKQYRCKATNPKEGTTRNYKYTITVIDTSNGQHLKQDPWISTH